MSTYDSAAETLQHIMRVRDFLGEFAAALIERGRVHDASKLGPEEKPLFDEMTPKLKSLVYGSEEYKASLAALGPALKHHYAVNSHHPEHHERGVDGMTLLDVVEMYCDWKAACERTAGGSLLKSLPVNKERFKLSDQLASIFENTAKASALTSEQELDGDPRIFVCQGPPVCMLQGKEAEAAIEAGCPWCKVITVHDDGTETVKEPTRA